jgi:hypothetical protein
MDSAGSPFINLSETDTSNLDGLKTLYYMYSLAHKSDDFDSDDENGEVTQGATIANTCYKEAIKSAGDMLRRFFATIKPTDLSCSKPGSQGTYSGINGVPLEADATSYGDDASHSNDHIANIKFYYNINDDESGSYSFAKSLTSRDPESGYFEGEWTNDINDDKVWIKILAIDAGNCDSVTIKKWIRIDSTRPTVTNIHKP